MEPYRAFYGSTVRTLVKRYTGLRPKKAVNWKRLRCGCGCSDCFKLDRFLTDPNERVCHFPVSKQRRYHLHLQLDGADCTHLTDRRGSPQTLVVTKTGRRHGTDLQEWR
ncbi:uncharacterized protein K452DRAFT_230811, partial [Aplosporella prunicola CBS 121167]